MKIILIWFCLLSGICTYSQEVNKKIIDPNSNKEIILGHATFDGLKASDLFGHVFTKEYTEYQTDKSDIERFSKALKKTRIKIVMATWCGDSKEQVPRFYKILEAAGYNTKKTEIICVDRKKNAGNIDISELDIKLVPTFILYKKGKEIGRIIETPVETLEKDLSKILNTL